MKAYESRDVKHHSTTRKTDFVMFFFHFEDKLEQFVHDR